MTQHNRVLSALSSLDEQVGVVFVPLEEGIGPDVVAAACRQFRDSLARMQEKKAPKPHQNGEG